MRCRREATCVCSPQLDQRGCLGDCRKSSSEFGPSSLAATLTMSSTYTTRITCTTEDGGISETNTLVFLTCF